ncbi:MAG: penicillin-binding protein 1A [Candidatus Eisenbacteria bacterium]
MRSFLLALLVVPLLMAACLYGLFLLWGGRLPVPEDFDELRPSARSTVYDREGRVIGTYFAQNRNPISLSEISPGMIDAVLAAEDHRFYAHWGVNLSAIARAVLANVKKGQVSQGASTITQQLARDLFLDQSRTLERKLKEMVLAVRLERSFSKDEILELYLNRIYFGEGAYGVDAAARRYFAKEVSELTPAEAATIAGIAANPSAFSPIRRPEAALQRRDRVLKSMRSLGYLSKQEFEEAVSQPLGIRPGSSSAGEAPYFLEYVRLQLMAKYGGRGVYEGGLRIQTGLDLDLQRAAEEAIETRLREIEKEHLYRNTFDSFQQAGSRAADEGTPYLQAALVALDPQTGQILAMVGGRTWEDSRFNRAVQARRQPGSSFKPLIYGLALQSGMKTNDGIVDEPVSYPMGAGMGRWAPHNFGNRFSGWMTLRYALAKSINIPSIKLADRLGPRRVAEFARLCGIQGPVDPYLSIALGTAEVTPLEMASVYAAFDNQGIRLDPVGVVRVEDRVGRVLQESSPATTEILDEKSSAMLVSMMQTVLDRGTAWAARKKMGFEAPAAGKTGTTDDYTDAWFIGFVPRCVCAVWVGFDEKKTLGRNMTGAKVALPIWTDFMKAFVAAEGEEPFPVPEGLTAVKTCLGTGQLAGPSCPAVDDLFRPGQQPHDVCGAHGGSAPEVEESDEEEGL